MHIYITERLHEVTHLYTGIVNANFCICNKEEPGGYEGSLRYIIHTFNCSSHYRRLYTAILAWISFIYTCVADAVIELFRREIPLYVCAKQPHPTSHLVPSFTCSNPRRAPPFHNLLLSVNNLFHLCDTLTLLYRVVCS